MELENFRHHRCILFVDNEGTKHSLISGVSENSFVQSSAEIFASIEVEMNTFLWISRVASASNIADERSRGETENLKAKGGVSIDQRAAPAFNELINKAFEIESGKEAQAKSS